MEKSIQARIGEFKLKLSKYRGQEASGPIRRDKVIKLYSGQRGKRITVINSDIRIRQHGRIY